MPDPARAEIRFDEDHKLQVSQSRPEVAAAMSKQKVVDFNTPDGSLVTVNTQLIRMVRSLDT